MTQKFMFNQVAVSKQTSGQAQETSNNSSHTGSGDAFFDAEIDYMLYQASSLKECRVHEINTRRKSSADSWRHGN
ncbi:hypothetical protein H6F77_17270 [Microcoleus sp. FACHB-831]|uniref:hypothetical protein n=1 Tax=Microcoleus sp. FACHB-831 TaxID=2692827 RepID=UPI0016876FF6|nr:hypothetical protein [Microcoleus sp. FACHB-831]MBD1922805.1 hypothetical protein [Microcoleus sp. FACHB-831]